MELVFVTVTTILNNVEMGFAILFNLMFITGGILTRLGNKEN